MSGRNHPALRPPAKPSVHPSAQPPPAPAPSEPEAPPATVAAPRPFEAPIHTRQTAIHPAITPEDYPAQDAEPATPSPVLAPPILQTSAKAAPVLAAPVLAPPVLAPPVVNPAQSPLAAMLPDAAPLDATPSPTGAAQRQAFRACIELSQEPGTYLLRMLPSGEAAPFGTYEAMVVLTDPDSDFFNAT